MSNVQMLHLLMSNWLVSSLPVTRQVAYSRIFSIFTKYSHILIVNQVLQFSPAVLSKIASRQEKRHNKNTSHPDRQIDRQTDRQTETWTSGLPPIHQKEMGAKEMFSVTSREEIEKQTGRGLGENGMERRGLM